MSTSPCAWARPSSTTPTGKAALAASAPARFLSATIRTPSRAFCGNSPTANTSALFLLYSTFAPTPPSAPKRKTSPPIFPRKNHKRTSVKPPQRPRSIAPPGKAKSSASPAPSASLLRFRDSPGPELQVPHGFQRKQHHRKSQHLHSPGDGSANARRRRHGLASRGNISSPLGQRPSERIRTHGQDQQNGCGSQRPPQSSGRGAVRRPRPLERPRRCRLLSRSARPPPRRPSPA